MTYESDAAEQGDVSTSGSGPGRGSLTAVRDPQSATIDTDRRAGHEDREVARRDRRIVLALFAASLTTFASMYSMQALLPSLSTAFGATPAHAALAVSVTTGLLALAIIPAGVLANRFGRTRVMIISATATVVIGLLLPFSPSLDVLLIGRAIEGVALAGIPAVAMAYLAEEISGAGLGAAMGVYVSGTTLGGLAGRLVPAFMLDATTWRWAATVVAVATALCAVWFAKILPQSRNFTPQPLELRAMAADFAGHLRNPQLLAMFGLAFVMMGSFVSVYNYLGYRFVAHPFGFSSAAAGLVFLMYLAGTVSSTAAGRLADRIGRPRVLIVSVITVAAGILIALPDCLPTVLLGILLFTAGFFGVHSTASSWVGAAATGNRSGASSLYMFAYYLGSAVVGWAAGFAYSHGGWAGLTAYIGVLVVIAAVLATGSALAGRSRTV